MPDDKSPPKRSALVRQWLAGIIGVRGDDREFLDERLRAGGDITICIRKLFQEQGKAR